MTLYGRMPEIPTPRPGTRLEIAAGDWQFGRGQDPGQPFTLVVSETRTALAQHYGNEWVWITGHAEDCADDHRPCREALVRTAKLRQTQEAVSAAH
ncbi:hypothetical protein [Micromonospora sp. NPDC049679]|uniref:hypothetical protein n=1 Tax=Micromonospora sp. NPDC049679 TaxID=3155920 RepID=UPI0033E31A77